MTLREGFLSRFQQQSKWRVPKKLNCAFGKITFLKGRCSADAFACIGPRGREAFLQRRTGLGAAFQVRPLGRGVHLGTLFNCVLGIVMGQQNRCPHCGAAYHRSPIVAPAQIFACVVCGSPVRLSDIPGQQIVVEQRLPPFPVAEL